MTIRKIVLITTVTFIAGGFALGYYEYNRAPASVAELRAEPVTAMQLFKNFSSNEQSANQAYLNKAVQVSGTVLEIKKNQDQQSQIILDVGDPMFGIACTMDKFATDVKTGDQVVIKGICTGYLNDVVVIRSLLLK